MRKTLTRVTTPTPRSTKSKLYADPRPLGTFDFSELTAAVLLTAHLDLTCLTAFCHWPSLTLWDPSILSRVAQYLESFVAQRFLAAGPGAPTRHVSSLGRRKEPGLSLGWLGWLG